MSIKLYNTLTRKKELFEPLSKEVGLYVCGPTVYYFAHIGNMRTYLFEDILKRVLLYNGHKVKHVMNITDVGHLTSDADSGEDKLEKGALKENKTVWQIADFYTQQFKKDLTALNVLPPSVWIKASSTIKEQIALIEKLEKKGCTYIIEDGVYFDTGKLKNYGQLWGNKKPVELKQGARVEMSKGKKSATDFALWKFSPKNEKRQMEWASPWGIGFPGWHTECVVMAEKELGCPFDIHCGGIDHISIHHSNEIAQSQAAFGNNLANFWLHGEFLNLAGIKMSKSKGNLITIDTLQQKNFNPLSYRYLCLTAHYRKKLIFTWQNLQSAQNGLNNLYQTISNYSSQATTLKKQSEILAAYQKKFLSSINNDLDIPKALAVLWQMLNDKKMSENEKYYLALDFDKVLGLGMNKIKKQNTPKEIKILIEQREKAREKKDWQKSDQIRQEIENLGWTIEDTPKGAIAKKITN